MYDTDISKTSHTILNRCTNGHNKTWHLQDWQTDMEE